MQEKIAKHAEDGTDGTDATFGAVYRVANYTNGGTGSATVACADTDAESQTFTAVAGGVQGSESNQGPNGTEGPDSFLIGSSFPGRMDWSTGQPKPNRLDGWIVFSNAKATGTLRVWALCVPKTDIPVQVVDY